MIDVKKLVYTYTGSSEPAVRGINFRVEPGEIFGFLGPSGAGKSTTQKVLIGLLKGYAGDVRLFNRNLSAWGNDLYERIGVSFELPNHYTKLSARENLNFFAALYGRETLDPLALLEMVGLGEEANTRVSQFSKGMKMRLNFVRALIHQPDLLFLDEPTTGLDPVNARTIKQIILEQKAQGRTVFLTTHDMIVADQLCDRVAFIVDGEIALIDSPRALKLRHGQRVVNVEYHPTHEPALAGTKYRAASNKHYTPNGETAHREFALADLGRNDAFLSLIRHNELETLHTQEATLEEIFIQTTGHDLSGEEA